MPETIRFKRWKYLTNALDQLGRAGSADDALEILREHARTITQADGVCVIRREADEVHYVGEDAIAPLWTGQRFPIEQCISGLAILEREPIVIPDIRTDPRVPLNAYLATFVASMAMFPLGSGKPFAAIGAYWREPHAVEDDALALLEALTRSANATFERLAVDAENEIGRRRVGTYR
jgi:GAF domain-containing protein